MLNAICPDPGIPHVVLMAVSQETVLMACANPIPLLIPDCQGRVVSTAKFVLVYGCNWVRKPAPEITRQPVATGVMLPVDKFVAPLLVAPLDWSNGLAVVRVPAHARPMIEIADVVPCVQVKVWLELVCSAPPELSNAYQTCSVTVPLF